MFQILSHIFSKTQMLQNHIKHFKTCLKHTQRRHSQFRYRLSVFLSSESLLILSEHDFHDFRTR